MDQIYRAKWIKAKQYHKVCETEFLASFRAHKAIASASLSITAHGVFVAHLNDARVGCDIFAPGWTAYDKRLQYMTYDVTPLLQTGENSLRVQVGRGWLFHQVKEWAWNGLRADEAALLCALTVTYEDGDAETLLSDESWKTRKGRIVYNDMYNGETLDLFSRRMPLSPAAAVNCPKDMLLPAEGAPVREQERLPGQTLLRTPKGETVIDFGQELTGYVEFTANAPASTKISVRHFEVLDKAGNVYTENLRSAKATYCVIAGKTPQKVKPQHTFYGFRYICVSGMAVEDPAAFTAIVVHSEMKRTGSFSCAHPLLNRFAQNVVWGQKGNFLDVPTDCPQRDERLGWTGDAQIFCRTAAINFDVRDFFRKWLGDLKADQRADGAIPHVCPYPWNRRHDNYASPAWADVAVVVPWELYLAYGDLQELQKQYPLMKQWVDYMIGCCVKKGEKEGKAFAHPWTEGGFGDWLSLEDISSEAGVGVTDRGLIATAYLAYDLRLLMKAGRLLGAPTDYYEYVYNDAVAFFRAAYMKNGRMLQDTQTAAALALVFGLSDDPAETARQLTENVRRYGRLTTGFVGAGLLLDALTLAGEDTLATDLLLREDYPSWLYPVTMGATTVWERWNGIFPDGRFADKGMNSFNHYAYGSVFAWMMRRLAGLCPAEDVPAYREIRFAPAPDARIPWVKAAIETDRGTVASAYEKTETGWRFRFTVPKGCKATAICFGNTYPLQTGENTIEVEL